jgi:hypothetical protein
MSSGFKTYYNVKYLFSYSTQQQQQSGMFQGNLPSYNNSTISFARSFAQFPPNRPSNQELSTTVELNTIDMSLDALYIHELHHMEVSAFFVGKVTVVCDPSHFQPNRS